MAEGKKYPRPPEKIIAEGKELFENKGEIRRPNEAEIKQKAEWLVNMHIEILDGLVESRKKWIKEDIKEKGRSSWEEMTNEEKRFMLESNLRNVFSSLRSAARNPEREKDIIEMYQGYEPEDLQMLADKIEELYIEEIAKLVEE